MGKPDCMSIAPDQAESRARTVCSRACSRICSSALGEDPAERQQEERHRGHLRPPRQTLSPARSSGAAYSNIRRKIQY